MLKNIVLPTNADVIFVSPDVVGGIASTENKLSGIDQNNCEEEIDYEFIRKIFGKKLIGIKSVNYKNRTPVALKSQNSFCGISIERISSFFYNLHVALTLDDIDYTKYESVVMTRPDIAVYRTISLPYLNNRVLYFNVGEGYDFDGCRKMGCAPVFPFANIPLGISIGKGDMSFNDQIMFGCTEVILQLSELYQHFEKYILEIGVPPTPETLIVFHMHLCRGIDIKGLDMTTHEIIRTNTPDLRSNYMDNYKYYL